MHYIANRISEVVTVPVCSSLFAVTPLVCLSKAVHLTLAVAPSAMENRVQQFDSLVDDNLAKYFDLQLNTD